MRSDTTSIYSAHTHRVDTLPLANGYDYVFISLTSEDLLRLLLVDPISLTSRWDSVIGSNAGISDDMD